MRNRNELRVALFEGDVANASKMLLEFNLQGVHTFLNDEAALEEGVDAIITEIHADNISLDYDGLIRISYYNFWAIPIIVYTSTFMSDEIVARMREQYNLGENVEFVDKNIIDPRRVVEKVRTAVS